MVWDEQKFVVDRINGTLATLGVVIQSANATTAMGAKRQTFNHFNKLIKGLTGE